MCDVTLAITAASTIMQGYQAKQQGEYQQGVEEYNARLAENEAQRQRNISTEEENIQRRKTAELLSRQRAQFAAKNVDLASGSPLDLQEDTLVLGEMDALRIRDAGDQAVQASTDEATYRRASGEAAATAGRNAFTGSLLTAGAGLAAHGVSNKWFTAKSSANNISNTGVTMRGTGQTFSNYA